MRVFRVGVEFVNPCDIFEVIQITRGIRYEINKGTMGASDAVYIGSSVLISSSLTDATAIAVKNGNAPGIMNSFASGITIAWKKVADIFKDSERAKDQAIDKQKSKNNNEQD